MKRRCWLIELREVGLYLGLTLEVRKIGGEEEIEGVITDKRRNDEIRGLAASRQQRSQVAG